MEATEILKNNNSNRNAENSNTTNEANTRALKPGTILNDQYEVQKVIGEGGFGITYAAFDKYLRIKVAIKEYFPAQFATRNTQVGSNTLSVISGERKRLFDEGLKSYEYEGERLTKLSNLKGIVSVLNFFKENGTAYMVMEFVEGCTLKDYLDNHGGTVTWQDTLRMMQPVTDSLKKIHEEGIIHRDISPDNIMISKDGEIKIIDFGAARYADDEKSKTVMLKHGYAPPEQYYSHGKQGSWTDVYALCAVMYRMLSGKKLPDAMSIMSGSKVREPISKYVKVPEYIENIISRGTEPDIDNRIKTVDELEKYLYKNMKITTTPSKKKMSPTAIVGSVAVVALLIATIVCVLVYINVSNANKKRREQSERVKLSITKTDDISENSEVDIVEEEGAAETDDSAVDNSTATDMTKETPPESFSKVVKAKDNQFTISDYEDGIKIDGMDSSLTEVEIPETIGGKKVLSINGASTNVISVVIPNGVKSIGNNAFKNCVYLERIYIPASVEDIAENAFDNCLSLKEIVVTLNNPNYFVVDNKLKDLEGNVIFEY